MNRIVTIKRHWLVTLLAAVCILLGTQTAWADDDPVTYSVTRTARSNTEFTFTMPTKNVEATVEYVDAKASIRPTGNTDATNDLYYLTLADALDDAADGDVIKLLANETITTGLTINNSITLDLNGHTLTCTGTNEVALTVSSGKTVTIQDGGTGGSITGTMVGIDNNGTLTVTGGTITGTSNNGYGIYNELGTLDVSGGTITCSGNSGYGIFNKGTLTVSGGTITCSGTNGCGIFNNVDATLTISGTPTISANVTGGIGIINFGTAFNLSGNPSLSGTVADIYLNTDKIITINAALTAPATAGEIPVADPWTVAWNNIGTDATTPYTFTSGWSAHQTSGTTVADPAAYFIYYDNTANITTRLVDGATEGSKEAQFVTYTALSDETATKPTVTAAPHSGAYWIGDELTATTTATPADGITWQWYRQLGDADPVAITGATSSTYTLSIDDYDYTTHTGYKVFAKATMAAGAAGTGFPDGDVIASTVMTTPVTKQDFVDSTPTAEVTTITVDRTGTTLTVTAPAQADNANANRESGKTYEYKLDADGEWQTSPEFTGLDPITEYTIYARVAATNTMVASTGTNASFTTTVNSTSVSGYNFVGRTLTGSHDPATIEGVSYKWYRAATADATTWTEITGATSATYTLTDDDVNKYLKFEVIKNSQVIGEYCDAEHPVRAAFDQKVTINGVTYQITNTSNPTVTISALPGEDSDVTGHKQATILATIPNNHAALVADSYAWEAYGFTFTSEATGEMNVSAEGIGSLDFSALGSSAGNYGYLTAEDEDVYNSLKGENDFSTPEGYKIYTYGTPNAGFYALRYGTAGYDMAAKDKKIAEDGMTAILTAAGMSGGAIAFKDLAGTALPAGTGDDADKFLAAVGQTVVVEVTLPTGYEFASDACKILKLTNGTSLVIQTTLADTDADGTWTAEFEMQNTATTISFNEASPIQGKSITYTYTAPDADAATVTADADNPDPVRVNQPLVYTIEPKHTGVNYYALTDLGLTDGVTASIVDFSNEAVTVTLPTETKVKVTLTVPVNFTGDAVTFAPVMAACAEDITVAANSMTTYFDTKALAVPSTNTAVTLFTVESVSGTTVTLSEIISKQVPDRKPFIIKNESEATSIRMDYPAGDVAALTVAPEFSGTAVTMNPFGGDLYDYYGFNGTDFVWLKASGSDNVAPHRCWLTIAKSSTSGARQLTLVWPDGTTTSLSEKVIVNSEESATAEWYTLDGRKLQNKPTKKGVYILNGKKKVVK